MEVLDDGNVRLTCTWTDYQTGSRHREPRIVSKFYRAAGGGGMQAIADDRFYGTVVGAEKSKLIREVTNRNLPAGLKMHFREAAERIIDERMTEGAADKIVGFFASKGVLRSSGLRMRSDAPARPAGCSRIARPSPAYGTRSSRAR